MVEAQPHISPAYRNHLIEHYDPATVNQLSDWHYAQLPSQPGQAIAYARVNQGTSQRPVFYIPGFTEGIIAKAPFAADLAERDYDVILPDQNRHGILVDGLTGRKSATYTQAMNMLAVLEAEDIDLVDVVTHSYGSLIFDEMVRQAQAMGQHRFEGSKIILLAPAGSNKHENLLRLGRRFVTAAITESRTTKDFPDDGDMLKAGIKNALANVPRTAREILELSRRHVDYNQLARLGRVGVVSYAEDRLYPDAVIEQQIVQAIQGGASWSTPLSCSVDGQPARYGRDASHNDEQFNPSRVGAAVAQLLKIL